MAKAYARNIRGEEGPWPGTYDMFDDRYGDGTHRNPNGGFGLTGVLSDYVNPRDMGVYGTGNRDLNQTLFESSIPASYRPDLSLPGIGTPAPVQTAGVPTPPPRPNIAIAPTPPPAYSGQMARDAQQMGVTRGATRGVATMAPTPPDRNEMARARLASGMRNRMGTTLTSTPLPPAHPFKGIGGLDLGIAALLGSNAAPTPPPAFSGQMARDAANPRMNAALGARSSRPTLWDAIMGNPGSSVGPVRTSARTPTNDYHANNSYGGQDATSFNNMDSQYY